MKISNGMITINNCKAGRIITVAKGHRMSIINNRYYIDGVEVDLDGDLSELKELEDKNLSVTINGNIERLEGENLSDVTVHGSVGNVKTMSGDVTVEQDINGSVSTMSGDVKARHIGGSVSTMSGDIIS